MAGDWLKMRIDLFEDPSVIGISSQLGQDEFAVVGRLQRLWGWANRQCVDGYAVGITADWIDRYVAQAGFAAALQKVGWLELGPDGARFPNFERHNGQSAKSRALGRNRQEMRRATTSSRSERDEIVTREEREKSNTPLPPAGGEAGFDALLEEYPAHRRNAGAALKRWLLIKPDSALQAVMVQAAKQQARSPEWQAELGKRVPNLSKWLHNQGWKRTHDDAAPAVQQPVTSNENVQPDLTPEQRRANKERAQRLLEDTRTAIAEQGLKASIPKQAPSRQQRESALAERAGGRAGSSMSGTGQVFSLGDVRRATRDTPCSPCRFFHRERPCG